MKYKIIDNALKSEDFERIKSLLTSGDFAWFFQNAINKRDENPNQFCFTHMLFNNLGMQTPHFQLIKPVLNLLEAKALLRIKCNLYPNINKYEEHAFHTDYNFEHKAAILYINSNNGFTILEDGTKIESIENRILMFNAFELHKSTNCTDKKARININFNYY